MNVIEKELRFIRIIISSLSRGILCKGLEYPPVHPKPVMSSLALKLPLCEMNTEKAELEVSDYDALVRESHYVSF